MIISGSLTAAPLGRGPFSFDRMPTSAMAALEGDDIVELMRCWTLEDGGRQQCTSEKIEFTTPRKHTDLVGFYLLRPLFEVVINSEASNSKIQKMKIFQEQERRARVFVPRIKYVGQEFGRARTPNTRHQQGPRMTYDRIGMYLEDDGGCPYAGNHGQPSCLVTPVEFMQGVFTYDRGCPCAGNHRPTEQFSLASGG